MSKNFNPSNKIKRCVIITGMSGAGKSSALNVFEDQGFYVIDNLPPSLIPQLLNVLSNNQSVIDNGIAVVVDIRGKDLLNDLDVVIEHLKDRIEKINILFVEATDSCLVRRYETTRRSHPLADNTTILGGITRERDYLKSMKSKANIILDSSDMTTTDFKNKLLSLTNINKDKLNVIVSSFGFKYGIPQDSDYIFDVRFLPNPNYVEALKNFSGKDKQIQEYLSKTPYMHEFVTRAMDLLKYVTSVYNTNTGKKQVHISVGCTGGRHRSVAVAETIASLFNNGSIQIIIEHRDIDRVNSW
ncbi:MAG: RNase adapter RapZ [Synergistaceae bacterium]